MLHRGDYPPRLARCVTAAHAAEAIGGVGTSYRVGDAGIAQHRDDWPELFLCHQSRIVGDIPNDRWLNEVTLPALHLAAGNDFAVARGILEEALHLLEVRLVLRR